MKTPKLLVAAAAAVTMALGAQAAAKRLEVKLLKESCDPVRGYWVEYEINGMKFRSDQTGERINTIAWNAMNVADKEKTIKAVYGVGSSLRLQFGDATSHKMGQWFDSLKGWKQGKQILTDKLIERDYPGLVARFSNCSDYYFQNFLPACTYYSRVNNAALFNADVDCPDRPELDAQLALGKYYVCDLAKGAYEALEKAEYMRTAAAVKSTAGDLIQLICDKCLVPSISIGINGGIGILSAPDAIGTAFDYFNSLTGWQDKLQESVVGKRANASDAMEVIRQMDTAIATSYKLIRDCTAKAHELQNAIDARVDEWVAARDARQQAVESDALVLKYREYGTDDAKIAKIHEDGVATPSVTARIEQLRADVVARQREYQQSSGEASVAAWDAYLAAQGARDAYVADMCASIRMRANAWKTAYDAKAAELRTVGKNLKAPVYPGSGTNWNNKKLYSSMSSCRAESYVVARAIFELEDYADKAENYHLQMRGFGEEVLKLADEIVAAGQPIYNDYLALSAANAASGDLGAIYEIRNWSLATIYYPDFEIKEADLFWRADPAFMDDVRETRSYIKLCKNYSAALETRRRYEKLQEDFRERVTKAVVSAKKAYETATAATKAAVTGIPAYVTEQQYYSDSQPGVSSAGFCLNNKTAGTELQRLFVDNTASGAIADGYRTELNQQVAGYTAKLLEGEDAYRTYYYHQSISNALARTVVSAYVGPAIDRSEPMEKLRDLQEDFNGHPYAHRVMVGAFGELDQTQESFVKNASATTGEGSDYVMNRIWRDSNSYSTSTKFAAAQVRTASEVRTAAAQTAAPSTRNDSMGSGSYAYHALNYYEGMNLPVKNPHKTLVQPLWNEISDIRAKVRSGQVDPTWQLKLFKNDGTSVNTNLTCCYGIPRRMPTADDLQWAKPGHVLKGWGSTSNATVVAFAPDALITNATAKSVTKTYYALWALSNEKYTLTCDPMGGSVKTAQYTVTVGKADSSTLAAATRRGFKFLGWYNQEEDGVQVFNASGKAVKGSAYWDAKGNWIYEANVTLYARWSLDPNAYLIRFHICDGTGLTSDLGFVYGTSTALPTCAGGLGWKNDGGIFKGWATSIENAVKGIVWQKDGAAVSTATAKGQTLDVYAVWETPMIRFVAGGGSGFMAPMQMGVNEVRKLTKCAFTPPAGKTAFAGWAGSNGRRYDDEMLVFNLGSVTMTAIWK